MTRRLKEQSFPQMKGTQGVDICNWEHQRAKDRIVFDGPGIRIKTVRNTPCATAKAS